jgi:hypothetical protein
MSRDMKVKLMMCKESKQTNEKRWKQKTFTKCKNQQLFTKKDFFFFSIFLRFHAANIKDFHSTTSYLCSKCTAKTYEQKDFFLAIDAETQSSNKEENEKTFFFCFCLRANQATKGKY